MESNDNYYYYDESENKEGFFEVFYGHTEVGASWIAEFANEDDACEYVDWKNGELSKAEDSFLDDSAFTEEEVDNLFETGAPYESEYKALERQVVDDYVKMDREWEK